MFRCLPAVAIAWLCLQAIDALAADRRPNLIAIVTDDQGRWAVGAYGNGQIHTPNMDRLAKEGALFENAFTATPVCSPSRAAYMSGLWPTEVKITDWISPDEGNAGTGLAAATWPQALQAAGYKTGMFGKWHLGSKPEFHPTKKGFDRFVGFLGGGSKTMNSTLEIDGREQATEGPIADVITTHAIQFVRDNRDQQFAVCLHFREPHLPYGPVSKEDDAHYDGVDIEIPKLPGLDAAKVKQGTRGYYASVSSVDRNLGRVLAALKELNLDDNTLVMFTSDHGYNEGRHYINTKGNGHWMAGGVNGPSRPNMWDTSVRIPLLARWPAGIKPGLRITPLYSNLDTYRTVLGALGVQPPADCQARGVDCSPLLRGESTSPRTEVFSQYDLHNGGLAYMRMIRTERYKFVKFFRAKGLDEFYDLQADPDENKNLFNGAQGEQRKALQELQARLAAWQQSLDDPILKPGY